MLRGQSCRVAGGIRQVDDALVHVASIVGHRVQGMASLISGAVHIHLWGGVMSWNCSINFSLFYPMLNLFSATHGDSQA